MNASFFSTPLGPAFNPSPNSGCAQNHSSWTYMTTASLIHCNSSSIPPLGLLYFSEMRWLRILALAWHLSCRSNQLDKRGAVVTPSEYVITLRAVLMVINSPLRYMKCPQLQPPLGSCLHHDAHLGSTPPHRAFLNVRVIHACTLTAAHSILN